MNTKKIWGVLFLLVLCFTVLTLVSCGGGNDTTADTTEAPTTDDGKTEYSVTVVDYQGKPTSQSVLIDLYKDGAFIGGMKTNDEGKMSIRLEKGSYTFKASPSQGEFYYDEEACILTEASPAVTLTVYNKPSGERVIYPFFAEENDRKEYAAQIVGEGATYVAIDRPEMSYYIFTPTRGGVYKFTYLSESALTIGYFGDANVVLTASTIEVKDRAFELEIMDGSIGTEGGGTFSMVIGIRSLVEKNTVLVIERIGDAKKEMQWTDLGAEKVPASFDKVDYLNHALKDVSVTDPSVKLVFNESDGYYHYGKADGPIVYVRITSASPYLAAFRTICDTTRMCNVFYNDDGEIVKKESYNNVILSYAEIANDFGIVPLNEELIYVIKHTGDYMGWWDFSAKGNDIFSGSEEEGIPDTSSSVVVENAWMFACCYIEEFVSGGEASPIVMTASPDKTFDVVVKKGDTVNFIAGVSATLKIENANGVTVNYGGKAYTANADGVIEVLMTAESDGTAPAKSYAFTMTCANEGETVVSFTFVESIDDVVEE